MRKIILTMSALALSAMMWAVPAKRGIWKTVKLADGKEVRVELHGDEHLSFWQAENGVRYVKSAEKNSYVLADMATLQRQASKSRAMAPLRSPEKVGIGGNHLAFIGKKKGLIILAEFTDKKFADGHDAAYYTALANAENFTHPDGHQGSVHDYYMDQSEGQFDLTFDVIGPIQLSHNMAYYGAHSDGSSDIRPREMVVEAVRGAASQIKSFADYDWFGDGYVDQVFVIYAGYGEASGGDENTIWPHRWSLYDKAFYMGGKVINDYACANELVPLFDKGQIVSERVMGIGTICHEFSHCLELPDLYDTAYTGNYGMGNWDVMDQGSYNGNGVGNRPCAYSGYERNFCGWKEPIVLTEDTEVKNLKGISEGGDYYIVRNDAYENEYYILENRSNTGWDDAQYGSGLLITYIDFDQNIWARNAVNTTVGSGNDHQRYTPFLADNSTAANSANAIAGDLYPYKNNNELTSVSMPAATLYHANVDGSKFMNKPITNITRNADGTVSFRFRATEEEEPPLPLPEGVFFKETFDKCAGIGGNDGDWNPTASELSTFQPDNRGWICSVSNGANKCAVIGTNSGTEEGTAITPAFTITEEAELTFNTGYITLAGSKITLSVVSGNVTLSDTEFTMEKNKWNTMKTTVSAPSYPVKCKIKFAVNRRRFFLDEVLVKENVNTGIMEFPCAPSSSKAEDAVYNLSGQRVGNDYRGIRIVNGRKVVR